MTEPVFSVTDAIAEPAEGARPSRRGLWYLVVALTLTYLVGQLIAPLVVAVWLLESKHVRTVRAALEVPEFTVSLLIGVAMAAVATTILAVRWPAIWQRISGETGTTFHAWVNWYPVQNIPLWLVFFLTIAYLIMLSLLVLLLPPETSANLQAKLFGSPVSRIVASLVVTTVVPVAEELIFRGALFNALIPTRPGLTTWQRNLAPFLVTSTIFAAVHYFAGVNTLTGIVVITLLSFYLGWLRIVTGSVKGSMVAHFTWNLLSALALSAYSQQLP